MLTVEEQVEVYGQLWDKGEVLVNGFDAMGTGFLNRPEPHLFALEEDLARVRPVETRQDLNEGALPGTVVADQAQHFPSLKFEVDIPEGNNGAEGFGNAFGAQHCILASIPQRALPVRGRIHTYSVAHNLTLRPKRLIAMR